MYSLHLAPGYTPASRSVHPRRASQVKEHFVIRGRSVFELLSLSLSSLVRFAPYAFCWHLWLVLRDPPMFLLRRCSALHLRRPQQPTIHAFRNFTRCTTPPLSQHTRLLSARAAGNSSQQVKVSAWIVAPATLLLLGGAGVLVYEYNQPFRHTVLAVVRCSRVAGSCIP